MIASGDPPGSEGARSPHGGAPFVPDRGPKPPAFPSGFKRRVGYWLCSLPCLLPSSSSSRVGGPLRDCFDGITAACSGQPAPRTGVTQRAVEAARSEKKPPNGIRIGEGGSGSVCPSRFLEGPGVQCGSLGATRRLRGAKRLRRWISAPSRRIGPYGNHIDRTYKAKRGMTKPAHYREGRLRSRPGHHVPSHTRATRCFLLTPEAAFPYNVILEHRRITSYLSTVSC